MDPTTAQWGQWEWSDIGPGRWHAVVKVVDNAVAIAPDGTQTPVKAAVLACGRIRLAPTTMVASPPEGADVHKTCLDLDGLRLRVSERNRFDIPTPVEPVTA